MNDCDACTTAAANPTSGYFRSGCLSCSARALAQEPAHFDAQKAGKYTPNYMVRLNAVFGDDWQAGHKQVREWSRRLNA